MVEITFGICLLFGLVNIAYTNEPTKSRDTLGITRHYQGDIYTFTGLHSMEDGYSEQECICGRGSRLVGTRNKCKCQCNEETPVFRNDNSACVEDLDECLLTEFVKSSGVEKIPYVPIPSTGDLVYPTAEISLADLTQDGVPVVYPACVTTSLKFLSNEGWKDTGNSSSFNPPMRLFRNFGKTYLQWVGDIQMKQYLSGRLLLISLLCRDSAFPQKPLFTPCIALRAAGRTRVVPSNRLVTNGNTATANELSIGESIGIVLAIALLLSTYVAASVFYLRVRWKKKNGQMSINAAEEGNLPSSRRHPPRNSHSKEFFKGSSITLPTNSICELESEDLEDLSRRSEDKRQKHHSPDHTKVIVHEDDSIYSEASFEEEMNGHKQRLERMRRELVADRCYENTNVSSAEMRVEKGLARFGLPIVEASDATLHGVTRVPSEVRLSGTNNGQVRRKLYFNPSYFDLDQLQSPPPGAVEFLAKMKEMISTAKLKMKSKSFNPSLGTILEDSEYNLYLSSAESSTVSRADSNSTIKLEDLPNNINSGTLTNTPSCSEITTKTAEPFITSRSTGKRSNGLVSEIIEKIDLKPRFPINIFVPPRQKAMAPAHPNDINTKTVKNDNGTYFPVLIKPSMFKRALNADEKVLTKHSNSFDNFRHEMSTTLNIVRNIGKSISPVSSPKRNGSRTESLLNKSIERGSPHMNDKVKEWLKSVEHRCKPGIVQNEATTKISNCGNTLKNHQEIKTSSKKIDTPENENLQSQINEDNKVNEQKFVNYVSETDSLRHIIRQANEKLPKMTKTEIDLCSYDNLNKSGSSTLKNHEECLTKIRSDSQRKVSTDTVTDEIYSPIVTTYLSSTESGLFGNPLHSKQDDHSYEEIQFSSSSLKSKNLNLCKEHIKEIQVPAEDTDDEGRCSIYSNPESLISKIDIKGEEHIPQQANNVLSIEILEHSSSDSMDNNYEVESKRRNRRHKSKIKRNDSIIQDSLERPKVKKKLLRSDSFDDKDITTPSFHGSCHNLYFQDGGSSRDIAYANETKHDSFIKRSKTLRTFKDYYEMKFFRKGNTTLSAMGTGINLTFKASTSRDKELTLTRPPLPPKQTKSLNDAPTTLSEMSNNRNDDLAPSLPPKSRLMKSQSFSQNSILKLNSDDNMAPALPPKIKKNVGNKNRNGPNDRPNLVPSQSLRDISASVPNLPDKLIRNINHHSIVGKSININQIEEADKVEISKDLNNCRQSPLSLNSFIGEDSSISIGLSPSDSESIKSESVSSNIKEIDLISVGSLNSPVHMTDEHYDKDMPGRVNGEFILSKSRASNLNESNSDHNNGKLISVMETIIADIGAKTEVKSISSNFIREELEKYLMNDEESNSIKMRWRQILHILEYSTNGHICIKDLQKYLSGITNEKIKPKTDDSGYQSTDSSDSNKQLGYNKNKSALKPPLISSHAKSWRYSFKKKKDLFQRSVSLQHLFPESAEFELQQKDLFSSNRTSCNLSLKSKHNPKLSIFFNDSLR